MSEIKAYIYLRVSGPDQLDGGGFERQEQACRSYARKNKIEVAGVWREEAVSGTADETQRPAFQEMIGAILSDGVSTVIVEGLDRLARELRIQEQLLIYLASKNVTLISARTGENITEAINSDPVRKMLVQIQGAFAELEKNLLVLRLRKGRERKRRETGRCEGRLPFGATPEERRVIQRIKLMRRTRRGGFPGLSLQAICDKLNAEGIPTKTGKTWNPAQVWGILRK